MLHSDIPLIVAIITEGCRIWEINTVTPKIFVDFHFEATRIFTECFWSECLEIDTTNKEIWLV